MGKGEGERWREVLYIMEMEREEGSYPVVAAFALLMPCFYYIQDPQRKTGAKKTAQYPTFKQVFCGSVLNYEHARKRRFPTSSSDR